MKSNSVEERIMQILDKVAAEGDKWSRPEWTKQIKDRFCELGKEYHFYTCASSNKADDQEWLYDVAWLIYDKDYLRSVPLVMECEWEPKGRAIEADFEKLLLARSKHRVMIFSQDTKDQVLGKIDELKKRLDKFTYTCSGDRYFFAGYSEHTSSFVYKIYLYSQKTPEIGA